MEALLEEIEKASKISAENRHRFITMLCTSELGSNVFRLSGKIIRNLSFHIGGQKPPKTPHKNVLIVGRTKFLEIVSNYLKGTFLHYKDCSDVLGLSFSSLIIDVTEGFNPNDLGILVETITEGGVILLISPPLEKWKSLVGSWEQKITDLYGISSFKIITGSKTDDSITPRFNRHFISESLSSPAAIVYDVDKGSLLKNFEGISFFIENKSKSNTKTESKSELEFPESGEIKKKLYKLCATKDQVRALQSFETFFDREKEGKSKSTIITADRGRGKTALLGIITPYLVSRMQKVLKRPIKVMVVAPTLASIQTYFHFLRKAMVRQGLKDFKTRESNKMTTVLNSKFARIEYTLPRRAIAEKEFTDIVIVDEAAGIEPDVLEKITDGKRYTVISSTIHGYEGTGRGILKFLNWLSNKKEVEVRNVRLEEPIRYGEGDPVERWLYDILLLDSQPNEIEPDDFKSSGIGKPGIEFEFKFEELNKESFINDQKLLKSFFGIYTLAHYRNKPSDFMVLVDFPNHFPFRVTLNGKTVCSIHVALEGSLDDATISQFSEGFRPKGQVIPDLIIKHCYNTDFPRLRGLRIVRIAVHPSIVGKGVGSFALSELEKWAGDRGFDWLGTVFGVNYELLNFWLKNAFLPVYISPKRNEISGEYSVLCLKDISKKSGIEVAELNFEFIIRLVELLSDELRDLNTFTAVKLLNSHMEILKSPDLGMYNFVESRFNAPILNKGDSIRMKKYFEGLNLYEYVPDIIRPLVRYFYSISEIDKPKLEEKEHQLLVGKCLQLNGWRELNWEYDTFKQAVRTIWRWYCGKEKANNKF